MRSNSDITCAGKEKSKSTDSPPSLFLFCCSCMRALCLMNMSKIGRARAQALGAKVPSRQPRKHWAPRHNNQTGSFTQTSFPFFLIMLSWCPVLALGAKKRYGCLLSVRASTRRHQGAWEHHYATIKMLSLSSCSFFRSLHIVELSNKNSF